MSTWQIVLVLVGIAALMFLFKFLFMNSTQQSRAQSQSHAQATGGGAGRIGAVAKQAVAFADASMRLVNRAGFKLDGPRINASLFMAGAVAHLSDKAGLGDGDRSAITGVVLERTGLMTSGEAYSFVADLLTLTASSPEAQLMDNGRETVHSWLSKKNGPATDKLARCVHEWTLEGIANI